MGMKDVGAYLRILRERSGLTQKFISLELNVSEKQVSRWENGLSDPAGSMLIIFTKLVGGSLIDLEELLLKPDGFDESQNRRLAERRINQGMVDTGVSESQLCCALDLALQLHAQGGLDEWVEVGRKLLRKNH